MARILAVVPDLLLASRVEASLRAAGHQVSVVAVLPASPDADAIVCDLEAVKPGEVAAAGPPVLGFYSHVDTEARRQAQEAGLEIVVPRSRMSRELPQLMESLLSR